MADQAQRRAPVPQPIEKTDGVENAFEELRHIIVSPEQEQIVEIRSRLDSPERRIEDVSSVVAEAIQMRRDSDAAALSEALSPTVQETLRESVRKNPQVLADALFPVMGPAIRKSITETLRTMLESFNEALEHSVSVQGVKWRIEAMRTGKPFAEIVLMHSLLFRVEQIFLIHRETGLVLNHVTAPAVATQDPSMVAGMLSAIQQFVHDSFESSQQETLDSMTVGGLEVWIEEGPHAVIAAVIRGHAPAGYREKLKEGIEGVEKDFSEALAEFQGDAGPFGAADERLQGLLVTQHRDKPAGGGTPKLAIAAMVLVAAIVIGWIGYVTYQVHRWSQFARALSEHPGIVVTSYEKSGGKWHFHGFRDPLASNPADDLARYGIDAKDADLALAPYYSLDDEMVTQRARNLLAPPTGVKLADHAGQLAASGVASSGWIGSLLERGPMVPGVRSLDVSQLQNRDVDSLQGIVLTFPVGLANLDPGQEDAAVKAAKNIRALRELADRTNQKVGVAIVGHTDSTGIEGTNQVLSEQRADAVAKLLTRSGAPADVLVTHGVGTTQPLHNEDSEESRHLNRSVTFRVNFSPAVPAS
jgi:outer membrane protein OmpA-like peptidoglycan-associated protein